MRTCFAGAPEAEALKQADGAIETNYLETQGTARGRRLRLQFLDEQGADAAITAGRNQSHINQPDLIRARVNRQVAHRRALRQNDLVLCAGVVMIEKIPMRLVLHFQKFADALFAPTKSAQIVTAAAFVKIEQKFVIVLGYRSERYRFFSHVLSEILIERNTTLIRQSLVLS